MIPSRSTDMVSMSKMFHLSRPSIREYYGLDNATWIVDADTQGYAIIKFEEDNKITLVKLTKDEIDVLINSLEECKSHLKETN